MRQDEFMRATGLPAFRVGGSVRDEVIGREPKDADYVIIADLDQARRALEAESGKKVAPLRLRNGTLVGWRVPVGGQLVEVCIPRREASTGPGHGDFSIEASKFIGLEDDARRRDFTMNALYRDVRSGAVLDPTNDGLHDAQAGIIRILSPTSFQEDPLRCLRAFRFMSTLGFQMDAATHDAMREQARFVTGLTAKGVSGTAVDELCKLLMGDDPLPALREMRDSGVLVALLPELGPMVGFEQENEYHDLTVDEHTFLAIQVAASVGASLRVRLALLFHDSGKPSTAWYGPDEVLHYYEPSDEVWAETMARIDAHYDGALISDAMASGDKPPNHEDRSAELFDAAAMRLNIPRRLRADARTLIERHMMAFSLKRVKPQRVRRLRCELGHSLARDLLVHIYCDASGKHGPKDPVVINRIRDMIDACDAAEAMGVPDSPKRLAVTGGEIAALGVEGPAIGAVQRQLLDEVACQPRLNEPEWLLARAAKIARKL